LYLDNEAISLQLNLLDLIRPRPQKTNILIIWCDRNWRQCKSLACAGRIGYRDRRPCGPRLAHTCPLSGCVRPLAQAG